MRLVLLIGKKQLIRLTFNFVYFIKKNVPIQLPMHRRYTYSTVHRARALHRLRAGVRQSQEHPPASPREKLGHKWLAYLKEIEGDIKDLYKYVEKKSK